MTDESATSDEPDDPAVDVRTFFDALERHERPVVTASEVARLVDCSQSAAVDALESLVETGDLQRLDVEADPVVWFPNDYRETAARERITVFPKRREIVADNPTQFTRARLSQFAHLRDTNRDQGYIYEVREQDIWNVPHDDYEDLRTTIRTALGGRYDALEEWVEGQWVRAHRFRLATHEDGYVVLEAQSADLLGNVAEQHLDDGVLRARIGDETAWVAEEKTADLKRTLYEAGYPVQDDRQLDLGDDLPLELELDLRPYQADWVARFADAKSGVLVGPPGSGKTVAALGIMADIEGETLILVPSRELAAQWRERILEDTSLTPEQVGEYHGGEKEIRPVTIATYQTAGMDRHRMLFDSRKWGLIVYDEVHHIPAPISRRSADLQTKHRLGLSATPIREDDKERDIYTLVGPPIGTDWDALFDAGYVAEPEVEIRYLPWASETHRNEYGSSEGHEKRQLAATNPAKIQEIEAILRDHRGSKAIVFVEFIEQGDAIAEALGVPFISGETPHARRSRLFDRFRTGPLDTIVVSRVGDEGIDLPDTEVAIAASGLGGSRRQGAQRAGRTMRPVGKARMYVLATRGTREEDFARKRTQHLASRGVRVREADPIAFGGGRVAGDDSSAPAGEE
ncbi:DEAD/DEAH box helicase [Natronomonas gomsonensis]|uniref:DEAD/DEAH box helicase n=1 Tax=Natronomonas gomsonensis TaxID=1046043 RepID=UPI0020CA87D2|nr:DEAD/DEAH box helicase [Natronomonas gomsonensis]MCY4729274.1 DEAD/DEAH box helicase [Natronomonas gomsonensis]